MLRFRFSPSWGWSDMPKIESIVKPDGTPANGILMDFTVKHEDWNVYELSDGTQLRVKNMLIKAYLIVDDEGNRGTKDARRIC
jgi:hypothetical protein